MLFEKAVLFESTFWLFGIKQSISPACHLYAGETARFNYFVGNLII